MFFGRELNEPAVWMRRSDASAAMTWIYERAGMRTLLMLPRKRGGFIILTNLSSGPLTVGYLAALMQRHDKPAKMEQYEAGQQPARARDMADVPFMSVLPYYDVLPKERPA